MHEFSLIEAMLDQVDTVARENHLDRITDIHLQTGELRQVIPEMMQTAFQSARQGTVAEQATLALTEETGLAECQFCETRFKPMIHDFQCPSCQGTKVRIIQGNDIILLSINGTQKGEGAR